MTKYRIALNKDRTMWFHAGADTPAETYTDIQWAETVAQQLRNGCYPDAHVIDVQPEPVKVNAHLAANPEPEPEPKYRSPMRLQRDQLREELKRAWDAIPPGIASRSDSVSAAVAKLAYAYEAIQTDNAKLREKVEILEQGNQEWVEIFDQGNQEWSDQVESLQEENAKLKDPLKAKPEPVADEEIRRVLDEMSYRVDSALMAPWSETQRWHDTLQAVAGDLVVARESLEQCKEALPDELRGGSVVLGISELIRSRTYAREQASQYARRYAEARDERDALSSTLSKKQAAIAKALEL